MRRTQQCTDRHKGYSRQRDRIHKGPLVEGRMNQRAFKDSQCGEEKVVGDETGRWMASHLAGLRCPCKEVCILKIPLKGGKQEGIKWLDFHCDSFEKRSQC